ncbi:MAG: CorA family divalent cation transporter [Candidatus Thorarchaeota archaeon]|jgi:Mg2+ and Co2+ transporter CorA
MIWVYTVTESTELQGKDASSLEELRAHSDVGWHWVDFMDADGKEFEILEELLGDTKITSELKRQQVFSRPETVSDYCLFSIPQAAFKNRLRTFPFYVFVKKGVLLTVRNRTSSAAVKNALKTFKDCVGKVCEESLNSAFILTRLFHEVSNQNLDVVMALRESINEIEEGALLNPADKRTSRAVFTTKREISALERVLWSQRELMLSISEGVVPLIEISGELRETLRHPINNISRELSLLDSHNNALDSILRLQDLGMIHSVERKLIFLTIMALFVSVLLILLEIDIASFLSR